MNKTELVKKVCERSSYNLSQKCAAEAIDVVFDEIVKAVSKGESAQFIGFGTFSQGKRAARTMISPATKQKIKVPEKKIAKFKPGKAFKDAVAGAKPAKAKGKK